MNRKVIVIGSGPAGLTSAIYSARANLKPLVFEGQQPGGQLTITTEVENFPGFPEGISGPDLMDLLREQAKRFGAETVFKQITKVDFSQRPFKLWAGDEMHTSDSVIISTGASARWLGLESEQRLMGYGVSACATCDGFFYRDKKVLVVGGGDSAAEEATFLTKFASEVWLVHRRDELRASKIMQKRVLDHPKINVHWNSVISEVLGSTETGVTGVMLQDTNTGETREDSCDGVFLAIGHIPNTQIFKDQIEMDKKG
ncbi:MAG: thioredoxin-disulfide reductase, partial [Candidatus Marinimicrobia bacterium]|nr:thioredoxin-disulfide reductase [Candidatus Neomarinimicrobiota bacterium]